MCLFIVVNLSTSLGSGPSAVPLCTFSHFSVSCLTKQKRHGLSSHPIDQFLGHQVLRCHVSSCPSFQRTKQGIVMVNFYNDYVTCSHTAKLSDVAGKPPLQPSTRLNITSNLSCCVHPCHSPVHGSLHRSLRPHKESGRARHHWFWGGLRRGHEASIKTTQAGMKWKI